jgi:phosphoribosylamine--glycine ligase
VLADSVKQAQHKAYEVAKGIQFDGQQYRRDIGFRAIKS